MTSRSAVSGTWRKSKDLMARRAYLYMQDMRREELETLWVQQPEHTEICRIRLQLGLLSGA